MMKTIVMAIFLFCSSFLFAYDWNKYLNAEHDIISKNSAISLEYINLAVEAFCKMKNISNEDAKLKWRIYASFPYTFWDGNIDI